MIESESSWLALSQKPLSLLAQKPRTAAELSKLCGPFKRGYNPIPDVLSWLEYRGMIVYDIQEKKWASKTRLNLDILVGFVADQYDVSPIDILHGGPIGRHVVARDHVIGLARLHGWGAKELARMLDRSLAQIRASHGRFLLRLKRAA